MNRTFKDEIRDCFPRDNEGKIMIPLNVDMDATLIYHGYDREGDFKVNGRSVEILKRWIKEYNCYVVIFTTRDGNKLQEVIDFYNKYDIPFHAIHKNQQQEKWTTSSKSYGFMIDDLDACCPVFYDENGRATVNWEDVEHIFEPRLQFMKAKINEVEKELLG